MHRTSMTWLRAGAAILAVSLGAALISSSSSVARHRTWFTLIAWLEHTGFWLGLVLIAGYILDNVLRPRHDVHVP